MCGYDPFYWYDYELDREYEANYFGFENVNDYLEWRDSLADDEADRLLDDMRASKCA